MRTAWPNASAQAGEDKIEGVLAKNRPALRTDWAYFLSTNRRMLSATQRGISRRIETDHLPS